MLHELCWCSLKGMLLYVRFLHRPNRRMQLLIRVARGEALALFCLGRSGDPILPVAFSPDGGVVVTASRDRVGKMWSAEPGNCPPRARRPRGVAQRSCAARSLASASSRPLAREGSVWSVFGALGECSGGVRGALGAGPGVRRSHLPSVGKLAGISYQPSEA
jgi:hypothetical protein